MNENQFSTTGAKIKERQLKLNNAKKVQTENLDIFYIKDFLSKDECEELIELTLSELQPSKLASFTKDKVRTSSTCYLGYSKNALVKNIDNKICETLGIKKSYSEVLQAQYYKQTQEYKTHADYFNEHEIIDFHKGLGQRTFTFIVYLNDVEEGGETFFPKVGAKIKPKRGMAVIWNNLYENGEINEYSLHESKPVISGSKFIITKWFRSNSSLKDVTSMFI